MTTMAARAMLLVLAGLCGCATGNHVSQPLRPGLINHVVFVTLHDAADADDLIAASDTLLPVIPSVVSYYAGTHIDTARATVLDDYDVGIFVAFDSLEGYAEYVDHPNHIELVNDWRPRIKALIVRDVRDTTP